jgi:hypothetical protein
MQENFQTLKSNTTSIPLLCTRLRLFIQKKYWYVIFSKGTIFCVETITDIVGGLLGSCLALVVDH